MVGRGGRWRPGVVADPGRLRYRERFPAEWPGARASLDLAWSRRAGPPSQVARARPRRCRGWRGRGRAACVVQRRVYADITKAEQAREIVAFADYWQQATGADPGLLVFDSQLTTYKILGELSGRGIRWLTLRQRGKTELARLDALPASAWKPAVIARSGRYRRPRLHEDMIKLPGISTQVRQIAIKNIGRDEPALLITSDLTTPGKNLFARYAERMMVENELDAYIGGSTSTPSPAASRSTSTWTPP